MSNRQVRLASRPDGIPQADNFEIVGGPRAETARRADPGAQPVFVGGTGDAGVGFDGRQLRAAGRHREVMRSFAAGEVIESRHPDYAPGDRVVGMFGWQTLAAVSAAHQPQGE